MFFLYHQNLCIKMFFSGPRKIKLKSFKFSRKKLSKKKIKNPVLKFGSFGLISLDFNQVTIKQLESARKVLRRLIKKDGKIIINILPQNPLTKKPLQSRMGKGKGSFKIWFYPVKRGQVVLECYGSNNFAINKALKSCKQKFPMRTYIVQNRSLIFTY